MNSDQLVQKGYGASYAVYRLAALVENAAIRQSLEEYGLQMLLAALKGDSAGSEASAKILQHLTGFGRDVGAIHAQNAELVLQEIENFKKEAALVQPKNEGKLLEREDIAPKLLADEKVSSIALWGFVEGEDKEMNNPANNNPAIAELVRGPAIIPQSKNGNSVEENSSRKEKILARIRQSGNCRVRDIQETMQDTSERTLRYDLQRLVQDGFIERIGPGGPGTYYRLKT